MNAMPADSAKPRDDDQSISALAGALAHEIKNPLSTINLNLQLLEEDWAAPQTPKERRTQRKLQVLQKEVQRLRQILEEFLRFVKTEKLQLRPTDINDLTAEIAEFIEPELAHARIDLREQYSRDLPKVAADPRLLKQAILNIILNAQQAMPEGGELILRTAASSDSVVIDVIDTGRGIPRNVQDKMFSPFFSTKKDGSGLGLAMTRRIVDRHGGMVQFHSETGKGTDFTIRIPLPSQPPSPPATDPELQRGPEYQ